MGVDYETEWTIWVNYPFIFNYPPISHNGDFHTDNYNKNVYTLA